ncbi:extracellular solute-binding protein [Microlunatus panaciterrae]
MPGSSSNVSRRAFFKAAGLGLGTVAFPSLLTACTGEKTSSGDKPKGLENVKKVELGEATPGVLYPEGYVGPRATQKKPFHDGSKTFKVVVQQNAQVVGDWNKNGFTKWMEERTGLKVEFQAILTTGSDGSIDLTKVNAMIASGELPDAFLGIPFSNDQISLYGQQGIFVALDDYIETYAPEMRRARTDYPGFKTLTAATDGKTYQFSGINDCFHCRISPGRAWINKKYLDKVGAKMPETTDDLRQVLKLFKDKDPTGKGNIIPFGANVNNQVDRYIMNAFLYNPGGDANGGWMQLKDGKVDFVANKPEWREGLKFLRTLYDDGTLTRDAFTMPDEAFLKAGNQGRLGFVRAYYWGSFIDITFNGNDPWRDYIAVPPLKGPNGVQYAGWDHYGYQSQSLLITSACKNPELLVQWGDYQMELEAIMGAYGGTKDKNWEWAQQGDKGINGKQAVFRLTKFPAPEGQGWDQYSIMYRSNDFRLGQYIDPKKPDFEKDLYEASVGYKPFAEPEDMQVPPLLFDESAAAQKADTAAAIQTHVKQSLAKFSVGELDINDDKAWSDYTKKFDAIGLKAYLDIYQQAYDKRPK